MSTPSDDSRSRLADPEAEAAVIGSILVDPHEKDALLELFQAVDPDDFDDTRHQRIFRAIRAVWQQTFSVDYITVGDELERTGELTAAGGRSYLQSVVEMVATSANILRHAQIVRERSVRRSLFRAGGEIIDLARNPPADNEGGMPALLDAAQRKIFEIADRETSGTGQWIKDLVHPSMQRIEKSRDRSSRHDGGVETGFYDLDDLTTGMRKGQLIIVAGRPGMGKTAFALNVASNAALNRDHAAHVALFSLEMSREELTNRFLCADAGVDSHALRTGRLPEDQLYRLADAAGRLERANIWIDDAGTQTPFSIRMKARRLKSRGMLDLVIIDYLQLVSQPGAESRQQEISVISRSFKALARELNTPVIALSQLNRSTEKEDRRPKLADLRESGSIEQDADVVMLLYREELYKRTEENTGKAEVIVAKQRNGPTDTILLAFDSGATRFRNLAFGRGESQ
ncbi:MAG: replicative DNA helicase [Planctomycetes bacterium]|nr:replicative DNA helicase [Planctomycetota bacterium]